MIVEPNFTSEYFEKRAGNDKARISSFKRERKWLCKSLGLNNLAGLRVLDIGCSTGEFALNVLHDCEIVYGIEPSDYAAGLAAENGLEMIEKIDQLKNEAVDLVIYRGTIQYIHDPFVNIAAAYEVLRDGGHIVFLATPNMRSIYYLLFGDLPFLEKGLMYWVPSAPSLTEYLGVRGFKILKVVFPYYGTPYADPLKDVYMFAKKLITRDKSIKFPFPGNVVEIVAKK